MANTPLTSALLHPALEPGGGATVQKIPQRSLVRPAGSPKSQVSRAEIAWSSKGIIDGQMAPYAVWLLRLTLGATFIEHVMRNLFGYVPPDIQQLFGLPPGVSPLAIASETLVAVGLLLGIWPRAAALLGAATLVGATAGSSGTVTSSVFGWPHPVLWIMALVAFALMGDGAFAIVPTPLRVRAERGR